MKQLRDQADEVAWDTGQPEEVYELELRALWEAETRRRVSLLARFFVEQWPESEIKWLELIFLICEACEAPGFKEQLRAAGAPRLWSAYYNRQLFADVMSVVAKQRRPSESAAVKHIVKNPTKFLNRYSKYKVTTLHRQFLRAKKNFEEECSEDGLVWRGEWIMNRDDAIRYDVEHYSAEAYRSR
jgi:hypothetical protein